MANSGAKRFVTNLMAACPNYHASKEQREDVIRLYLEKLEKWRMAEDTWARALSKIIADTEGNLPPLSTIYGYLKSAQAENGGNESLDPICLAFDLDSKRGILGYNTGRRHPKTGQWIYALKRVDPSHLPPLPQNATDPHVIIPPDQQHYEPCSLEEGREEFRRAYLEKGDPRELRDIMRALETKAKAKAKPVALPPPDPVAVADYDDEIPF